MGYFDGLSDAIFKTDAKGRSIFYPWGVLGKGYILSNEPRKQQIRRFIKFYYMVSLPSIIAVGILLGWIISVALLPIFFFWYFFATARLLRGLPVAGGRLSLSESYQSSAQAYAITYLWFMLIFFCITFVLAGIDLLLFHKASRFLGLTVMICCGAGSCVFGYMIKIRNK